MSPADRVPISNRGIYQEIVTLQHAGRAAALAMPIRLGGSVPFAPDSKLLIRDDGSLMGTVGGGLLEAEVVRQAAEVIAADAPRVLEFDLTENQAAGAGMICGGRCVVLIEPVAPDRAVEVYAAAARAEAEAARAALITVLADEGPFHKLALQPDGTLIGSTGDDAVDAALRESAEQCAIKEEPCFVEQPVRAHIQPIFSSPSLYIFGAGHIAIPLAHLAALVGFRTTVIDDRAEFANTPRFPQADGVLVAAVDDAFAELAIGDGAYVVAITRGHVMDEEVVARALRTAARYIGMIGSKRKVAAIRQRLRRRGFSEAELTRLHAPIGVEIGAETVEEIAVSIVAQLIAVRRGAG
jgi:xanthine dehydrogenase accessory factor